MSFIIFAVGLVISILVTSGIYMSVREVRALMEAAEANGPRPSSIAPDEDDAGKILAFQNPPLPGTAAPRFQLEAQDGRFRTLEEYSGRPVALIFSGPAFTPGSMKLALDLRDLAPELAASGVEVVGIGSSSWRRHAAFSRQHLLDFELLSDPSRRVAGLYGAAREGEPLAWVTGKIRPTAVLIGADGRIVETITGVGFDRLAEAVSLAVAERFAISPVTARFA